MIYQLTEYVDSPDGEIRIEYWIYNDDGKPTTISGIVDKISSMVKYNVPQYPPTK